MLTSIKKLLQNKLVRFVIVGGINTVFGYMLFSSILYLTKMPYLSVIIATIIGVLFNFKTYGKIVFKSKDNALIYKFFGVYTLIMLLQMLLIKVFSIFGVNNVYIVAAIITLPMALLSFTLMNRFVFNK